MSNREDLARAIEAASKAFESFKGQTELMKDAKGLAHASIIKLHSEVNAIKIDATTADVKAKEEN